MCLRLNVGTLNSQNYMRYFLRLLSHFPFFHATCPLEVGLADSILLGRKQTC